MRETTWGEMRPHTDETENHGSDISTDNAGANERELGEEIEQCRLPCETAGGGRTATRWKRCRPVGVTVKTRASWAASNCYCYSCLARPKLWNAAKIGGGGILSTPSPFRRPHYFADRFQAAPSRAALDFQTCWLSPAHHLVKNRSGYLRSGVCLLRSLQRSPIPRLQMVSQVHS